MICSNFPFKRIILAAVCKLDSQKAGVGAINGIVNNPGEVMVTD